jgi:hypothetical protein
VSLVQYNSTGSSSDPTTYREGVITRFSVRNSPGIYATLGISTLAQCEHVTYGTAAPTTGAWLRGATRINTAPSASGYLGWVCTESGTPGTWKGYGTIQS